jgi:hypothetical protein
MLLSLAIQGLEAWVSQTSTAGRIWQIPSVEDMHGMKNWLALTRLQLFCQAGA